MSSQENSIQAGNSSPISYEEDIDNLLILSEKSPQIKTANDLNNKINAIAKEVAQLSNVFGLSNEIVEKSIGELKQQNLAAHKSIAELGQVNQSSTQRLDEHGEAFVEIKADFSRVDVEFAETNAAIEAQQNRIIQLNEHLIALEKLEHSLQKQINKQATDQSDINEQINHKIQHNKLHIQGLQALHSKLQSEMQLANINHQELNLVVDDLCADLTQLEMETLAYQQANDKRYQWSSIITAGLAIIIFTGLGFVFYNHEKLSLSAEQKISALSTVLDSSVEQQSIQVSNVASDVENIKLEVNRKLDNMDYILQGPGVAGLSEVEPVLPLLSNTEIKSLAPEHYSLQLLTVNREQDVINYINQRQSSLLDEVIFLTQTSKNGIPRFSLFLGDYESYSQAQAALNALPLRLSSNAPWIRKINDIQKVMQ